MTLRSKQLRKNIGLAFVLKAIGVGISFLQLPLTISYLTEVEYGIWVTVFSTMNWINVLDMGIGLGVRNKLAISISSNDIDSAKAYISTGIFSMCCIAALLLVVLICGLQFVEPQALFNTQDIDREDLYSIVFWTGIFVIMTFALSIVNQFYYAYQDAAKTGMISVFGSVMMLGMVYWLTLQESHNLLYFVFAFGISSVVSKAVYIAYFFVKNSDIFPSISTISIRKMYEISGIGIKFFIIQICTIFCFSMMNILITQILGPQYVRTYDVIFKLLNFFLMLQTLMLTPLWSAYTDAYVKQDYAWIRKAFHKTNLSLVALTFLMVLVAWKIDFFIWLWLHIHVDYSYSLLGLMVLYQILMLFNGNNCYLLNGIGEIDWQLWAFIVAAALMVPMAYCFSVYLNMGLVGIVLANDISMLIVVTTVMLNVQMLFKKWK